MANKEVQRHILSRETIKPSSQTPHHLKHHKQSLLDQLAMQTYIPLMLFYDGSSDKFKFTGGIPHRLKTSLSETLIRYYPFAGRLSNDGLYIDCNDHGVVFVEAQIECELDDFLRNQDSVTQNLLFPEGFLWKNKSSEDCSLLGVQVSFFTCGGVAICLSSSHKIADGATISTFLQDWAVDAMSLDHNQSGDIASRAPPIFLANSMPQLNLPYGNSEIVLEFDDISCITKRYTFNRSSLATLKKSTASLEAAATRVEIVTALLYKCAIASSSSKKSLLIQVVNMRARLSPPLPENSIGNFTWFYTVSPQVNNAVASTNELIVQLQNGKRNFHDKKKDANGWVNEVFESAKEVKMLFNDLDVYRCSSFCKWPFYGLDFGWGKPKWVSMADLAVKNCFVLFDTPDGDGIEALVTLEEEDMKAFQVCQELLSFATIK